MYAMWWNKPLSPNEPFILRGNWVPPLAAFMYMCSEISGKANTGSLEVETRVGKLLASMSLYSKHPEINKLAFTYNELGTEVKGFDEAQSTDQRPSEGKSYGYFRLADKECLDNLRAHISRTQSSSAFFERRPRLQNCPTVIQEHDPTKMRRWGLAATAVSVHPILVTDYAMEVAGPFNSIHFEPQQLLAHRVQNWPWDDLLRTVDGLIVGIVLWLASFAYGTLHAAAWAAHSFPTTVEMWLWRASAVYIAFCGGLWIVLNSATRAYAPLNKFWEAFVHGGGRWWQNAILGGLVVVCGSSFVLARGFVVVEAFASVRSLPPEAYDNPEWSEIFPHF